MKNTFKTLVGLLFVAASISSCNKPQIEETDYTEQYDVKYEIKTIDSVSVSMTVGYFGDIYENHENRIMTPWHKEVNVQEDWPYLSLSGTIDEADWHKTTVIGNIYYNNELVASDTCKYPRVGILVLYNLNLNTNK